MKGRVLLMLLAVVHLVSCDETVPEKDEVILHVCPEERSYCIPRKSCPFRLVSHDFAVQMRMDPTKAQSQFACGRVTPTETYVCCMEWNKMADNDWEPSQSSWFLNAKDGVSVDMESYTLWPGYKADASRQQRRIGDSPRAADHIVELEALNDTDSINNDIYKQPEEDSEEHRPDTEGYYEDQWNPVQDFDLSDHEPVEAGVKFVEDPITTEERWVVIHPAHGNHFGPVNPFWPFLTPFLRHVSPLSFLGPTPAWKEFLPTPQRTYEDSPLLNMFLDQRGDYFPFQEDLYGFHSSPEDHIVSVDEDSSPEMRGVREEKERLPEVKSSLGEVEVIEDFPAPFQFSVSTSHVSVGGKSITRTRVEEGGKAREEVVVS